MMKEEMLQRYYDWVFRMSAYNMALSVIYIDKMTVAPRGGEDYRDKRAAFLSGELFTISTDPEMYEILKVLKDDSSLDGDTRRAAYLYYTQMEKQLCIPKEEFIAFEELSQASYNAWLKAKTENDYSIFEPYLKQIIEMQKKLYGYRQSDLDLYDRMLDDFEPGMTKEKYDLFFSTLRERIVPLVQKIREAEQIPDVFLKQDFSIEQQKKFTADLLEYLHFDPEWGYQNETEHPFTSWTCENDCRTTTKYVEDNVVSAVFSTIHEVGHAYYEHQCDPAYDGMILSEGISSGMHESQSRLCENYLGRTEACWEYLYPVLQKYFPEQLGSVAAEDFYRAVNISEPSLIRTEADELTYPIHIMIRYEIEKGLFSGEIPTENLNLVWNEMYRKYLGVEVKSDREGILQDVHWSGGSFGYFPTYALGSAFAAQFMHQMRQDIDVDEALRSGHYEKCMDWLKEHVHRYGCRYDAEEILQKVTGESFSPSYYLDYLETKYKKLYGI